MFLKSFYEHDIHPELQVPPRAFQRFSPNISTLTKKLQKGEKVAECGGPGDAIDTGW